MENSSAKLIPADSLVVAMYGDDDTAGNVAINKVPVTTNQACCNFVIDPEKADYQFLYYYLKANYNNLVNLKLGGSQHNLNAATLKRFPVPVVPLQIQRKIAAILSAYDDLIANNQRRIALLESMAEEIYSEWFVRMRFPSSENVRRRHGIPESWCRKRLGSILEFRYGKALQECRRVAGGFLVYGSGGIVGTHNEAMVPASGLIVGRKGNVGAVYYSDRGFFPIDTVFYVVSKLPNTYLYHLLRSMNFINNDSAVPGLSLAQAYSNELLLPDSSLIAAYERVASPLFEQKRTLRQQVERLQKIRDVLLPRLISGKLKVDHLDLQLPPSMRAETEAT